MQRREIISSLGGALPLVVHSLSNSGYTLWTELLRVCMPPQMAISVPHVTSCGPSGAEVAPRLQRLLPGCADCGGVTVSQVKI